MLDIDDPLLPVEIDLETYVHRESLRNPSYDFGSAVASYHARHRVRIPAFDPDGQPATPPDAHVLDHLARVWDLVDAARAGARPAANTVACPIDDRLECDLCGAQARYETWDRVPGGRELVYACVACLRRRGVTVLGAGQSTYLMYEREIPPAVRAACDAIRARQGRGSIWGPVAEEDVDEAVEEPRVPDAAAPPGPADHEPLAAPAVSARLRRLWLEEAGPLLAAHDHDLADETSSLLVRRVASTLVVSGQWDFGEGDPFDGPAGVALLARVRAVSEGAVTALSYEDAKRGIKQLRRAATNSLDIYHPDDVAAPSPSKFAAALGTRLSRLDADRRAVLAQVWVAGVGKFRTWLAVPTEEVRRAIGSTPGVAADLKLAMNALAKGDSLYDVVVDAEASSRYEPIDCA